MHFTAGETVAIETADAVLVVKVEDASKSESISVRVEEVKRGTAYQPGQIHEFNRSAIKSTNSGSSSS